MDQNTIRHYFRSVYTGDVSVRSIAREIGCIVGEIHAAMGCRDQEQCTGKGCRING